MKSYTAGDDYEMNFLNQNFDREAFFFFEYF